MLDKNTLAKNTKPHPERRAANKEDLIEIKVAVSANQLTTQTEHRRRS